MNILRIILAVLAIVLLIVSAFLSLDPHDFQFAILPLVCFLIGYVVSGHFELGEKDSVELTAAPRLLATRAPPLS